MGKPPPQCRWGAFENPQFKWVPETYREQSQRSRIGSQRVFIGSPKGPPLVEHGRGLIRPRPDPQILAARRADIKGNGPRSRRKSGSSGGVGPRRHALTPEPLELVAEPGGPLIILQLDGQRELLFETLHRPDRPGAIDLA